MFAFDEPKTYNDLDRCIDASRENELCSIAQLIRGQPMMRKRPKTNHVKPTAMVRFNTRLGKAKPVTCVALLDSGGAESIVTEQLTEKLRVRQSTGPSQTWSTPNGELSTNKKAKSQFTLPEFHDDKLIEWDFHVTKTLGAYDIIIGRDLMKFLGIDIKFSQMEIEWEGASIPFRDVEELNKGLFHANEPDSLLDEAERIKKILDAKYEAADLEKVCQNQEHLSHDEQQKLFQLLRKYEQLFDGTLGKWTGSKVSLELAENAKPYHAKAFPVPRVHYETLRKEVERLCEIGVLKRVNRSQWAAPTFLIPKKDGSVRFISDFRELNKRIKRKPYPIPNIQDMLLNLDGFQYATSLDLNMGYYHLELDDNAKELCTIVLPFGKFEYQRTPMGLCNSPDIFQEKMNELFTGLDYARAYIDDLLAITKESFDDHLEKLERIFVRLQQAGLKVNAKKSFFARAELEYLGYWITREGIQPMKDKVQSIMNLAEPKTRKELRSFMGLVNYCRDMWIRRSHVLAPLAKLTSKNVKWEWSDAQRKAFAMCKKIIAKEVILRYPDFKKPFVIHTDASHYQLGAVISQDGKPIAFYSRKLNGAQSRYTTTERELLSIVETLKAYRNILLGHAIEVHTDHKNLVYKTFNTERVMRWRLIIEEFGPDLKYIKGEHNVVADVLSRMNLTETEFSVDAFAFDEGDFPESYPLSYKQIAYEQQRYAPLQAKLTEEDSTYRTEKIKHSDFEYDIIMNGDDKIVLPPRLQRPAVDWYHQFLCHPGETRMELTLRQHYDWRGLRTDVKRACKACAMCLERKKRNSRLGKLPAKVAEATPWHTLCIDLIGPYDIGTPNKDPKQDRTVKLHCLTMIDPATGWFEIAQIDTKRADYIANYLEFHWLTRYPWPTEVVMDRGKEFCAEVSAAIKEEYGLSRKLITTRNPQANSIVERVHKTVHNMIATCGLRNKDDLDARFGFQGVLSSIRRAVNSTVHTTLRATPTQLVFGRDALLNVSFQADWELIRQRKQRMINLNNARENSKRVVYNYTVGQQVDVRLDPNRKHGEDHFKGPYTVSQINDNGTVKLTRATTNGAVSQTWNIRNIEPRKA